MATKEIYAVDLKIPRPYEINVDGKSPTLDELREYISTWLLEAEQNGRMEDVFVIAKAFGDPVDISEGKLYIGEYPRVFNDKDMKMVYWPQTEHLEIFVAGKCKASIHGPGSPVSKADDYYLPGPWEAVLARLGGKAEEKLIQIGQDKARQRRQELIKILEGGSL